MGFNTSSITKERPLAYKHMLSKSMFYVGSCFFLVATVFDLLVDFELTDTQLKQEKSLPHFRKIVATILKLFSPIMNLI